MLPAAAFAGSRSTSSCIENPPFTRHNGFNLVTYERGRIDKGEKLTIGGNRKRLDLYPDGTFIAYATFKWGLFSPQ